MTNLFSQLRIKFLLYNVVYSMVVKKVIDEIP